MEAGEVRAHVDPRFETLLTDVGGGGLFDGPQFVFNLGGGPGIRVHQFGGHRPQRRPREPGVQEPPPTVRSTIAGLLPLLILFMFLLSSLFGGDAVPSGPNVRFNGPEKPYTLQRTTKAHGVDYWVNPVDVADYKARQFTQLDGRAEASYIQRLRVDCERENNRRQHVINEAQGWFFPDAEKMMQARRMPMEACKKLQVMGQVPRGSY